MYFNPYFMNTFIGHTQHLCTRKMLTTAVLYCLLICVALHACSVMMVMCPLQVVKVVLEPLGVFCLFILNWYFPDLATGVTY